MKKYLLICLVAVLTFVLLGCSDTEETEELRAVMQEVKVTGSFVAEVRDVIPGYVLDEESLHCAVVTLFQDTPFVVYIGERAEELMVGEKYVFEIKEENVGQIEESLIDVPISYLRAFTLYGVQIEDFHVAKEDEWGLNYANEITYEALE